jgi:dTDP-glucose pyrophosphorylase/mevalonate kinase
MTRINATARARIGLLGNPSDLYGGRGIGFTCDAFSAEVELSACKAIDCGAGDPATAPMGALLQAGWEVFRDDVLLVAEPNGRGSPASSNEAPALMRDGVRAQAVEPFAVTARTDVPRQVGLAGSSALLTALLRALARWCGLALPPHRLAWLVWRAEQERLGIRAGPMDRTLQAHEGLLAMDFARPWEPDATRRLDPALLPPLVLAWDRTPGESSGAVHSDVYERWAAGDADVIERVARWAPLVDAGVSALHAGDVERLIALVNENFDLRASLLPIAPRDRQMIDLGRSLGAGTKFCGSGGAVLAVARDEAQQELLRRAYDDAGFGVLLPRVHGPAPLKPGALRVVVLAAGFATRLYPLTRDVAKPLLEVGGVPMLTRLVHQLAATGAIADVVVVHNQRFAADMTAWRDACAVDLPVHLIDNGVTDESDLRGAVADLALALEQSPAPADSVTGYCLCAGDNLLDQPLDGVLRAGLEHGEIQLLVRELPGPVPAATYSEVCLDDNGVVTSFREKPADPQSALSALAFYVLPLDLPELVSTYLARPGAARDAPGHLFAWLCGQRPCRASRVAGRWFDIGNAEQLAAARAWAERV